MFNKGRYLDMIKNKLFQPNNGKTKKKKAILYTGTKINPHFIKEDIQMPNIHMKMINTINY